MLSELRTHFARAGLIPRIKVLQVLQVPPGMVWGPPPQKINTSTSTTRYSPKYTPQKDIPPLFGVYSKYFTFFFTHSPLMRPIGINKHQDKPDLLLNVPSCHTWLQCSGSCSSASNIPRDNMDLIGSVDQYCFWTQFPYSYLDWVICLFVTLSFSWRQFTTGYLPVGRPSPFALH